MSFTSHTYPVVLRPSLTSDLPFVLAAERQANDLAYVGRWSEDQHQAAINSADKAHFVIVRLADKVRVGYAILEGLTDANHSILLRRIVVTQTGQGYGRAALRQLKQVVFETYHAHRFWLDVKEFNPRARYLYESEGFVLEGCLRDALKTKTGYHSKYIMALLQPEYHH